MKPILITIVFIAVFSIAKAQKSDTLKGSPADTTVYSIPEVEPTFPGGMSKFYEYFIKSIRIVDTSHNEVNVQPTLLVEMIIEKDGSISNVKILKDTAPSASASAIKALNESPKWTPGMLHGKLVRVRYQIKSIIEFQMDDQ